MSRSKSLVQQSLVKQSLVKQSLVKQSLEHAAFLGISLLFLAAAPAQEAHSAGWVAIPVAEYQALHAKAYPTEPEPEVSVVQATMTRADYDLQVKGDLASGRVTLTVDVLRDGWVRVPIPTGLLVREARLDGKLVSLVPSSAPPLVAASSVEVTGGGPPTAVLSHAGRSVLVLQIALPVSSVAGNESIVLPAADSGITRASVQLSRLGVDVQVAGGLLSEKSESAGDSRWIAYGRGNEALTFSWRRKTEDHRTTQPLRMRGALTELVSLGEDSTSVYAECDLEVVQGAAAEVRIRLPENVTVNQVLGATVADWEMKNGELAVKFLEPVEQGARFVLNGETHLARDGKLEIPLLRILNTEKDSGGVAAEVLGAGEIKDVNAQGMEEADASDLGEMIASRQSPSLAAYRYRSGDAATPRSLSLNVVRYAQQAVLMANVEEARYQVLMTRDGKSLIQARYAIRNNQRNFVKITLPSGGVVWSATLAGKPIRPGQATDGSLLLPLEKARGGEDPPAFIVEVLYLGKAPQWDDKGSTRMTLPALDLPISRTGLLVYYPPQFRLTAAPGMFRTEPYAQPISEAFNPAPLAPPPPPVTSARSDSDLKQFKDDEATRSLVDKFRAKSREGKVAGILPMGISFPAYGPSLFLISELTSENQAGIVELTYQHDKKGAR